MGENGAGKSLSNTVAESRTLRFDVEYLSMRKPFDAIAEGLVLKNGA